MRAAKETRGWSLTANVRSLLCRAEVGRLVITIEGYLVVKGVITNYGTNGEVRFGQGMPEREGMVVMDARLARGRARGRARVSTHAQHDSLSHSCGVIDGDIRFGVVGNRCCLFGNGIRKWRKSVGCGRMQIYGSHPAMMLSRMMLGKIIGLFRQAASK